MQVTRRRHAKYESSHSIRRTDMHTVYDFTCPQGRLANDPAGVSIMLPSGMEFTVKQIHVPKEYELQGRVGAIRIRHDAADLDVLIVVVYAHTETTDRDPDKRNVAIWHWVDELIAQAATRTTPIILTDANGHVGHSRGEGRSNRDRRVQHRA